MDIQKQREAFEAWWVDFHNGRQIACNYIEEDNSYAVGYANAQWVSWQAAQKAAIPEGFVLVDKSKTEHWYLDEGEGLYIDEPDNWLCDMDIGDVQAVEHKEYLVTESNILYATKVWDDENKDVDSWQFFTSKDEAEKAAAHCKAKFWEQELQDLPQ